MYVAEPDEIFWRTAYVSALLEPSISNKQSAEWWISLLAKIDSSVLAKLYSITEDPFPWRPFLLVARAVSARWPEFEEQVSDFESLIRDQFDEDGMSKVYIDDVAHELISEIGPKKLQPTLRRWGRKISNKKL